MGISSRTTEILRLSEENEGLKSTNDFLAKQLERRVNQLRKYRKALEEIREIIRFSLYTNSTKPLSEIDFLINLVNAFRKNFKQNQ